MIHEKKINAQYLTELPSRECFAEKLHRTTRITQFQNQILDARDELS